MAESKDKLDQLQTRLDNLAKYEAAFKREIADLRKEITLLRLNPQNNPREATRRSEVIPEIKAEVPRTKPSAREMPPRPFPTPSFSQKASPPKSESQVKKPIARENSNIEQYIGKYLISIIGVLVTVIGVGIGAKFAIDNNWITPLMRIVFGYLVGLALIGVAVKLKAKYETFSSVLLSGGMAIMYFITYFAFGFYELLSQTSAFMLMVIFTVFTVLASIIYNRQIIAHLGLVGAYAVPFLLSNNSGRAGVLFSYIAIINIGILALSVYKYWKSLFYSSFIVTWLIFIAWYIGRYDYNQHFALALFFLSGFFLIFYGTFLVYKLIHKKALRPENIALILQNSFIFFGLGYSIILFSVWDKYLGLFTIGNAIFHYLVASLIHKFKLGDRKIFYLVVALSITFLTISIPVQLNGNWITLAWMAEALFLFVIGRTKKIALFEYFSYSLMVFAVVSLVNDWQIAAQTNLQNLADTKFPIVNKEFVSSFFVAIGFGIIYFVERNKNYRAETEESVRIAFSYFIPTAFLLVLYNTFRMEIDTYFRFQEVKTALEIPPAFSGDVKSFKFDNSLGYFNFIWQIKYSMFFLTILSFLNIRKIKSTVLGFINLGFNSLVIFVFLTAGLVFLTLLRGNYIDQTDAALFDRGIYHIVIAYLAYAFLAGLIFQNYRYTKQNFITKYFPPKILSPLFDLGLSLSGLIILTHELISWTQILGINESNKLGLSILWGLYAISLIIIGIIKRKKHLRIFAIGLFGLTLIKLFIYDIAELGTIQKTVVFVSIDILLLISSFLYNKYTKLIFEDEEQ